MVPRADPDPRVRARDHPRRRRSDLDCRTSLGRTRRSARDGRRHRAVGGAVRADRRPPLSRADGLAAVLATAEIRGAPCRSGRAVWRVGRDLARSGRRLDRLPPRGHPAAPVRRRRRSRHRGRSGDWTVRQLVQPGAVRPTRPTCPGVYASTRTIGCPVRGHHDLPPNVPLRGAVVPRPRGPDRLG